MRAGCFDYNKDDEYIIIYDNGKGKLIAWTIPECELRGKCKWLLDSNRGIEICEEYNEYDIYQ